MMNTAVTIQREVAALAIVHHANQYVVTDGYDNRVGISGIVEPPRLKRVSFES